MSRLNLLKRCLSICLVVSLCLQLIMPVLQNPALAHAAITGNHAPARSAAPALPGPATAPTQSAQHLLQLTLDLMVRQSVSLAGWQVSALDSKLDLAGQQASAQHLSGAGLWHVEVLDEAQRPLTLDGTLAYEIKAQPQDGAGNSTTVLLKGTLQGPNVQLAVDVDISGDSAAEQQRQTGGISLQLTSAGKVSHITARGSGETKQIANDLTQSVFHSSIERDGVGSDVVQTLTSRDLGRGESEAWLKSTVNVTGDTAGTGTIDKHFFQRLAGNELTQYMDRYDVETAVDHYTLQSPAEVTATPDGGARYDLTLVNPQGRTIHLSSGPKKTSQNIVSPAPDAGALGLMAAPAESSGHHPGLSSPLPRERSQGFDANEPSGKPAGPLSPSTFVTGILLSGCNANCIMDAAFAVVVVAAILLLPALAGLILASALEQYVMFLIGIESIAVIIGSTARLTQADPYFVRPDTRPAQVLPNASLLEFTRLTGGLVTTGTLAFAATMSATIAGALGGAPGTGGPSFDSYNDRAPDFVGSSIPAGATAIGPWTWDAAHAFGASASHTQLTAAGLQRHYFIHAAQTITVSSSDNLVQYVYLDAQHPPSEIYVQFYTGDGDGEHRAFWGQDKAQTGGTAGTSGLYAMGPLPDTGRWVRLKVPAGAVGLAGKAISGVLYGSFDGQTWWGPTTTSSSATDSAPVQLGVDQPAPLPATQPGAQIAFRLSQATRLNVEVFGADGNLVRTLLKDADRPVGYQVVSWDAHNDSGALVEDKPYRVRFSAGGQLIAETGITISPFVASIQTPGAYSVVRGNQVPLIGEAYGTNFSQYVVEFGAGLKPTAWQTIISSTAPVRLPSPSEALRMFNPGNLAQWDTGLSEFEPYHDEGLNGLYTVRLRVSGSDGREAVDSAAVVVGRLAHTAAGGTITSPDGKARLSIPRLATEDAFTLMALMPLTQLEPGGGWRAALPADKQLAGEVYEVLPAGTGFRQNAVLELAYPAASAVDRLGIWQGDGTPGGWRFLGGSVDRQAQTISVPVVSFGSVRAWVAVFDSPTVGTPPAAASGRLAFDAAGAAPLVVSGTQPFDFYSDLTSGPGEWEALDLGGTQLTLVRGAQAGLSANGTALQVTHLAAGARVVRVRATAYDAAKAPLLSFDYRAPEDYAPNLLVRSHNVWWQFGMGSAGIATTQYFQSVRASPLNTDGAWHHYQLDLLGALRASQPAATDFQVDEIVFGQYNQTQYNQVVPIDDGTVGSAYYIANFAALGATAQSALTINWTPPGGVAFNAYSYALDQLSDTLPAEAVKTTAGSSSVSLPAGAGDGLWYMHVRGRAADGRWSAPAHFPLLIDRQAPQVGRPDPAPGGAGLADFIQLPIDDSVSGIDLASVRLQLNGKTYSAGSGLSYDPETHFLELSPYQLQPAPEPITSGQKVELALVAMSDYAGNKLAEPFSWSFTADRPAVVGEPFRRLTSAGGESPALSPDGSQLAFVSKRSGTEKVWLMRTDDFDEQAHSAAMLSAGTAREADPSWSPDGKQLAFVSYANGSSQIWVSDAAGGSARALSSGGGAVASPSWSPDGRSLAFVQDGNLWQVNSDGSGLRALTRYPEQPMRAVRWQPGGQFLAVHFKLYQETIELYDLVSGELKPLTAGGADMHPAWLNAQTLLYDAPVAAGQPSAIWQINLDGTGLATLAGSPQPGSADMQPAAAGDGSALAIVSTRGGARNIWLQASLQLTSLDVLPAAGAPAGEGLRIEYMLPAAAEVTLQVLGSDGSPLRTLLDKVQQSKGSQSLTWDGSDAGGKALAAGDYTVLLSAQVAGGGDALKRYASARVLDANSVGTLQLQIQQWSGQTVGVTTDLHAEVFEQGIRTRPVAQLDHDANPSFNNLTAGRYDLIVSYGDTQRELDGIKVTGRQITQQRVDLQLGALELSLLNAPGQPVKVAVFVQLARSDDPARTAVAFTYDPLSTFVLAPGRYDALVEVENVRQTVYALEVRSAETTRREIDLGSGIIALQVFTSTGHLGESGNGRVFVQALRAEDQSVAADDFNNPTKMLVPAGRYDLRVTYDTTSLDSKTGGTVSQIITGVEVQPGATVTRDLNLHMGSVHVSVLEAADTPADPARTEFFISQRGQPENQVVTDLFVNSTQALLPAGTYDIGVEYSGTELHRTDPVGSFEISEGETVATTVNLKLGHLRLEVVDASGAPVKQDQLSVSAYPAGARDSAFAMVYSTNPLDLALRAGTSYDLVVSVADTKLTLPAQSVGEGQVRTLKLNVTDFK